MKTENKCIDVYCKKCKKSFRVSYAVTGIDSAKVLESITMKCGTCKRTLVFKEFTEAKLIGIAQDGKAFV